MTPKTKTGGELERLRFKGFLELQVAQEKLKRAAERSHSGEIAAALFQFLSACNPSVDLPAFHKMNWMEVFDAYIEGERVNRIPDREQLSIISGEAPKPSKKDGPPKTPSENNSEEAWHYLGRTKYYWIHIIANAYHWPLEDIYNLWPEEAFAYIQEIVAEEYYQKAFLHGMSETSYYFDKTTKKTKYVGFPKPPWMMRGEPTKKKANRLGPVPTAMKPVGLIRKSPVRADSEDVG